MDLSTVSDDLLLAELERRQLSGERLLRECKPHTIAAELMWRASKADKTSMFAHRPFFLNKGEARALARHAVDAAMLHAADMKQMVPGNSDGIAYLKGAAMLVLEKIEPGRWSIEVGFSEGLRNTYVLVDERE